MTSVKTGKRYIRLLPSVLVIGTGLLFLKGSGLVHEAYAQDAATQETSAAAPSPATPDYAGNDTEVASAAEVDVLTSLSKRRAELDTRESQLKMQANILAATEQRVDAKIAELKQLQGKLTTLVGQRDDAQKAQIAALVKTYGPDGMAPAKAAAIFNDLPDDVLIPVAQAMKPGDLGAILSKMNPDNAQKLTVKLANRLTLPDISALSAPAPVTPEAAGTPPIPAAAAPAQTSAAGPIPVSQAAAAAKPKTPGG
jgi:flagellar motility protein MotE (MotC chaperone)